MLVTILAATLLLDLAAVYEKTLVAVESGSASVEELFRQSRVVRDAVGASESFETLSPSEFAELDRRLRGMILNREEVILAEPEPEFFLDLA